MKKQLAASALLSLCLVSANAMANDAVLGALLGGGAGAIVGRSIGGRDGTIIGGALGAAAGAAIGSEQQTRTVTRVERRVEYVAAPTYHAPPPTVVYYSQPVRVAPSRVYYVHGKRYYRRDDHHDHRSRYDGHRDWR